MLYGKMFSTCGWLSKIMFSFSDDGVVSLFLDTVDDGVTLMSLLLSHRPLGYSRTLIVSIILLSVAVIKGVDFPPFLTKGNKFCVFLFAFLHTMPFLKKNVKS